MPVEDIPVHPLTVGGDRYTACQNKVRKAFYFAPNRRYRADGTFVIEQTKVEDRSSTECRFDMSLSDPKCDELCPRRGQGEQYDQMVRSKGT